MKNKIAILFHTKSSRALNNGSLPIYLRITVDGVRIEVIHQSMLKNQNGQSKQAKSKAIQKKPEQLIATLIF